MLFGLFGKKTEPDPQPQSPEQAQGVTGSNTELSADERPKRNTLRKIVVVDDFDHIPGSKQPTISGNHVKITGNRLSVTGRKLHRRSFRNSLEKRGSDGDEGFNLLVKGQHVHLSAENMTKIAGDSAGSIKDLDYSNSNVYVSEDSIWTLDPNEPIIEESPKDYDSYRRLFFIVLSLSIILGILLLGCVCSWVFHFGPKILFESSLRPNYTKNDSIIDQARGYYNIHTIIMASSVYTIQGLNSLIFRIFPHSSKYALKCIHTAIAFIGSVGGLVAFWFAYQAKQLRHWRSITTLHATIGLVTLIVFELQFIFGFAVYMLPWASFNFRSKFLPVHRFFGGIAFICSVTAVVTGTVILTAVFIPVKVHATLPLKSIVLNTQGILAIIFALLITYLVSDHHFRRRPRPEIQVVRKLNADSHDINGTLEKGDQS